MSDSAYKLTNHSMIIPGTMLIVGDEETWGDLENRSNIFIGLFPFTHLEVIS